MKKEASRIKSDKAGQFYLISAIILATAMASIFLISNYITKDHNLKILDLEREIRTESKSAIDYVLNNDPTNDPFFKDTMLNLTESYVNYTEKRKSIYFIFGTPDEITISGYQQTDKNIILDNGASNQTITTQKGDFETSTTPSGTEINLYIDQSGYSFELETGKNFFFIISENINGNEYLIKG
ncbi:MAG: hypothetical protein Q8P81_00095 [Nanoarchaeota archaeon]|nr:hypothetical protein [Nanoarchaeota archaeon]